MSHIMSESRKGAFALDDEMAIRNRQFNKLYPSCAEVSAADECLICWRTLRNQGLVDYQSSEDDELEGIEFTKDNNTRSTGVLSRAS
mmetsp:Transcript_753/g.1802  ORF Transcript_753/g.1802 Transcript_753/m.1802 type:complete len:87 (+) Transcript_753:106-366(+)